MRRHDWSATPLGPPERWPAVLKSAAGLALGAAQPTLVLWGAERLMLCNGGFAPLCGDRFPDCLGHPLDLPWPDARTALEPYFVEAFAGRSCRTGRIALSLFRDGLPTEGHFTVRFIPLWGDGGGVSGLVCTCEEVTGEVMAERIAAERRRTRQLRALASAALAITTAPSLSARLDAVIRAACDIVGAHQGIVSLSNGSGHGPTVTATHLSDKYGRWRGYAAQPDGTGIYAWLCEQNRPVRMTQAELQSHPRWQGFGSHAGGHPPMRGWLAAPLVGPDGANLGLIQLSDKSDGSEFDETDEAIIVQLAQFASAAIEQAQAEERLQESRAVLSRFIDGAPAAIAMFDRDMRYLSASRRFVTDLGLPAGIDLIGRSHYDVFPEVPEHWRAVHRRVLAGETLDSDAEPFYRPDGSTDWIRWRMEPWHDVAGHIGGAFLFSEVITAQRSTEAALREALMRFEVARKAAKLGIYDWDIAAGRLDWDDRVRELWGLGLDDPVSYDIFLEGLHPDDRGPTHAAVTRSLDAGGTGEYAAEFRVIGRHDGAERWVAATGQAFFRADRPVRLTGTVAEVTTRRRAEEALATLNAELERKVQERTAQLVQSQKMEAIGQLTGGVAHDFNNLLQGIGSCVGMLRRHVPEGKPARLYEAAMDSIQRGGRLTQSLLSFARRQTLAPKPTDLTDLLEGMRPLLERTMGGLIRLDIAIDPDSGPALVDPAQLESAILNLAINARDAMPDGGLLTLRTGTATLEGAAAADPGPALPDGLTPGSYVTISVRDTGQGMDADTLAHAFEPFFTTKGLKGSGLGLSMVHGMAAQSGGGIWIDSAPGQGTQVTLYLPPAPAAVQEAPAAPQNGEPGTGKSLLLVDDDAIVRFGIKALLETLDYTVLEADCGEAAIAILEGGAAVDILVTDYAMPGMNGATVVHAARRLLPGLPALIITGYADIPNFAEPVTVLHKPFRPTELEARVASMLQERTH